MLIQIVRIASAAAAQEVLRAHAPVRRLCKPEESGAGATWRRPEQSFKPPAEIYPAVTLCLIGVRGCLPAPSGETGPSRELRATSVMRKIPEKIRLKRRAA
jgi:hypothetical protein